MTRIRPAKVSDIPAIYKLVTDATKRGKILKRSHRDIEKAIHHFWVAEGSEGVVGCCSLEIYNKKLAEVRSLAVALGSQKKGIASGLIEHCLKLAKKKKVYEVLAITDRENLFKRFGFSEQLHGQKSLFVRP